MHLWRFLCAALLTSLPSTTQAKKYNKAKDAILLSNVRTLTLQKDKLTTGRRFSPVQQLSCIGGNARGRHDVDVMRCKNSGSEYDPEDIQWTCQASLPPEFKLGSTDVICEGYDSPDDQHVLKGSCGVEYRLVLTEAGEEKFGKSRETEHSEVGDGLSKVWTYIFWLIFIAVVVVIILGAFDSGGRALGGAGRGWGGFGGGGGGGDDDDPPPPYTPRSQPRTTKRGPSHSASTRGTNSGPGFWSGAGLGGAAGYAAGNYMGSRSERSRQERQQYTAPGPSNYGGGSSWFGGGGGSGGSGAGPSRPSTSSSSMPSSSSSNYESTGFGGTRRR